MSKWKLKVGTGKQGVPLPEASRFDRLTAEDLYLLLESGLSTATRLTDTYRAATTDEKQPLLGNCQTALEDALAAVKAMRRKLVVTAPMEQ
jgi:hypothetical protein